MIVVIIASVKKTRSGLLTASTKGRLFLSIWRSFDVWRAYKVWHVRMYIENACANRVTCLWTNKSVVSAEEVEERSSSCWSMIGPVSMTGQ